MQNNDMWCCIMPAGSYVFETLRAAREEKALSQRELSAQVGLPQSHISKIEHGIVDLQISSLLALARALDLEMLLVPRKLVPAVEAIINGETSASSSRDDRVLRAAADLTRIGNLAKRLASSDKDGESHSRLQRAVRELANLRLTDKDLTAIRAVLNDLKEARNDPKKAIADENSALTYARTKRMSQFSRDELAYLADKARLPEKLVLNTAAETVERFHEAWKSEKGNLPLSKDLIATIEAHVKTIPIANK